MILRDYQQKVIDLILTNSNKTQLYVLPTGAGKTVIFSELTQLLLNQNKRVLILAHRTILTDQIKKYNNNNANLRIETKQSYYNRLNFTADYVIIDEVHNVDISQSSQYKKILNHHKESFIIGFTATPVRLNNGLIYGEDKLFKKIDFSLTPANLINQGYLVPYKVTMPFNFIDKDQGFKKNISDKKIEEIMTKRMLIDAVTDSYKRFARKKTLIFATSINHAEILQEDLFKNGIISKTIHSNLHKDNIKAILQDYHSTYLNCLINVNMLTEGFDEPQVDTLILARPTTSIALHRQIIGRGLRLSPNTDKIDCLVIDLVGNFDRLGDINDKLKAKKERNLSAPFHCPFCIKPMIIVCDHCGFTLPKSLKEDCEKIRSEKEISQLIGEDFKTLDLFARKTNMSLIVDVKIKKTATHLSFYFQIRKLEENNTHQIIRHTSTFTDKSVYFLSNFLKKFDFQGLEEKQDLDYYYSAVKKNYRKFKMRYVDYTLQEKDNKNYFKINKII